MRFLNGLFLCSVVLSGNLLLGQTVGVSVGEAIHQVEGVQVDGQTYLPLDQVAGLLGLQLERQPDRVELIGPSGRVILNGGRPLIQIDQEYLLLNQPVRVRGEEWLLPLEFVERVLPRVLKVPVRLLAQGEESPQKQVSIQVLNSPTRVSLVFLSSDEVESVVTETERAVRVQFQGKVQFLTPLIRPEPTLVSSLLCTGGEEVSVCQIQKGIDFRSHREQRLSSPDRLLLDVFSTASMTNSEGESGDSDPLTSVTPRGLIVTIDPGHGGEDRGISVGGVFEKDISARLSLQLATELQNRGLVSDTTRNSDFNPSLEHRSAVANGNHSSVFVSLHVGRNLSRDVRGPVVFTHETDETSTRSSGELRGWETGQSPFLPDSKRLASLLQERLNRLFQVSNTSSSAPLAVLAPVQSPAVLIEAGQLTNQEDSEALSRADFQHELAVSIADAIEVFLR